MKPTIPFRASAPFTESWQHFDVAVEAGDEAAGRRATYGVSPGDEQHPAPYAYVSVWTPPAPGDGWDAVGFAGAERGWEAFVAAEDPPAALLAFFEDRRAALGG